MKPIDFPQSTKVLQRPSTMTENECSSLPVWSDGKQCVSCWKPSFIERLKILFTGKVWIGVLSGNTQPPIFISGEYVFAKASIKDRICDFLSNLKDNIVNASKSVFQSFRQADKRKHFIVGFMISVFVGLFIPWLGLLLGCVSGFLKEWWDKKGHGTSELMDFVFTCLGSLLAFALTWIIHLLIL